MSKSKDAGAAKAVLDYLTRQNRPYSAIDICNNLHKEFGKTAIVKACESLAEGGKIKEKVYGKQKVYVADQAIVKACESLAEGGKIKEKVYGKQKVYVADQNQFPDVDDSEIKEMDKTIATLTEEAKEKQEIVKQLESELKTMNSCISTEDAQAELQQLILQHESSKKKLAMLKDGGKMVSPEEKERIYTARNKFVKEWRKRKRISNDILGAILEGYPKSKKELYEDVGIETDEEHKVSPPEL